MFFCFMLYAAAIASSHATASGVAPSAPYILFPARDAIEQINFRYSRQLKALHDEGLAIRRTDGGSLTPAHHAELQAKLDSIQASYRRAIERVDPLAVDSHGMRRER